MRLTMFEDTIDPVILKRGLDYHRREKIMTVKKQSETTFKFQVSGAKNYIVWLSLMKIMIRSQTLSAAVLMTGVHIVNTKWLPFIIYLRIKAKTRGRSVTKISASDSLTFIKMNS